MTRVLGISSHYHDSGAALLINGELVASASEDRFTLLKHDASLPKWAIQSCLAKAGLKASDLDQIVYYENPYRKFSRVFVSTFKGFPSSRHFFVSAMRSWLTEKLWIKSEISRALNVDHTKVAFSSHHLSHAVHAIHSSPFSEAAILVADAVGEWSTTSLYSAKRGFEPELLEEQDYPHSLGLAYSAITHYLGFSPNDSECSTMALAAFGQPRHIEKFNLIWQSSTDGRLTLNPEYFCFEREDGQPYTQKFVELFGPPREFGKSWPYTSWGENAHTSALAVGTQDQNYADIAATTQYFLEEQLLKICRHLYQRTGSSALCLAGGVAMNSVAVGRLVREGPFESVFVPPDPTDCGAAIGAACLGTLRLGGKIQSEKSYGPFGGFDFSHVSDFEMLKKLDLLQLQERSLPRQYPIPSREVELLEGVNDSTLYELVTKDLLHDRIVGWYEGRFENGPRALGHRSIFVNPQSYTATARLSADVKHREAFRPYALSMTQEFALQALELEEGTIPLPAKWMQMTTRVREEWQAALRMGVHIDKTTRPQVIEPQAHSRLYHLLKAFGRQAGHEALINTSMNSPGMPLVSSPMEALILFLRTSMDTLVIGNSVLRKKS